MEKGIEVYLRPLGDGAILNIYVPRAIAEQFARALAEGSFSDPEVPVDFEMSVLPQWYSGTGDDHVRVPVTALNLIPAEG